MSESLNLFLERVAAGEDAHTEEAALGLSPLGDAALPALQNLLADTDPDRRWWAARALAVVATTAARELLIDTLDDPNPHVRACAALGLGELGAEEAVEGLVQCMAGPSAFVSRVAADSLAHIGQPAVPALITALQSEAVLTRIGAARALRIIQPKEAVPALCAALNDPSATVTFYAEQALERMGVGLVLFRP